MFTAYAAVFVRRGIHFVWCWQCVSPYLCLTSIVVVACRPGVESLVEWACALAGPVWLVAYDAIGADGRAVVAAVASPGAVFAHEVVHAVGLVVGVCVGPSWCG